MSQMRLLPGRAFSTLPDSSMGAYSAPQTSWLDLWEGNREERMERARRERSGRGRKGKGWKGKGGNGNWGRVWVMIGFRGIDTPEQQQQHGKQLNDLTQRVS